MKDSLKHLFDFLEQGVSPFHAAAWAAKELKGAGFEELDLKKNWKLEKGGRYFVIPFGTTLYAFTVGGGKGVEGGVRGAGAHTDTPVLKVKPHPEMIRHGHLQLNTEVYGARSSIPGSTVPCPWPGASRCAGREAAQRQGR